MFLKSQRSIGILSFGFFGIILLALNSYGPSFDEKSIIGNWFGTYQQKDVLFLFDDMGAVRMSTADSSGREDIIFTGSYSLDFTKRPIPLSITNIPQLDHSLFTILEFQNINSIKLAQFAPKWKFRAVSFDKRNTTVITRQENL